MEDPKKGTHGFFFVKMKVFICDNFRLSESNESTVVPRFQIPELTFVLWLGLTWTRFTRYFPAISGTVIALSESRDLVDSGQAGTGIFSVRDYACDRHPASINGLA